MKHNTQKHTHRNTHPLINMAAEFNQSANMYGFDFKIYYIVVHIIFTLKKIKLMFCVMI